jgi:DNA gyrase subunit A
MAAGIALAAKTILISLAIRRCVETTWTTSRGLSGDPRRWCSAISGEEPADTEGEETSGAIQLSPERYVEMSAQGQVVPTQFRPRLRGAAPRPQHRTTGAAAKACRMRSTTANRVGGLCSVEDSDQITLGDRQWRN